MGQLVLLTTVQERNTDLLLLLSDVEAFKTHLKTNQRKYNYTANPAA